MSRYYQVEYINAVPCIHSPGCPAMIPKGVQTWRCGCRSYIDASPGVFCQGHEIEVAFTPSQLRAYAARYGSVESIIAAVWNGKEKF